MKSISCVHESGVWDKTGRLLPPSNPSLKVKTTTGCSKAELYLNLYSVSRTTQKQFPYSQIDSTHY